MLGTMKTQITLSLDKSLDAWSRTFSFDTISPAGEILRTGNGILEAVRVIVELT